MELKDLKVFFEPKYLDSWIVILASFALISYQLKIWFLSLPCFIVAGLLYMKKYGKKPVEANT